jgi:hypothetical protein
MQKMKADNLPTVTMNIKRPYFAAILSIPRRKKIEYREMKPYWETRLKPVLNQRFKLRLLNGMTPPVPEATVMVEKIVRDYRNRVFQLHLGRGLEVKQWDRKMERPTF